MQDRQPGAPGQYKAVIAAAELQKMQAGDEFIITMTRDDQPVVEGTPYSKAAVLPDFLAALICPDVLDPTPADAFSGLLNKTHTIVTYAATIPTSNWSAYGDAYVNTLYISGILATDNPFVDVLLTSGDTATQAADMKICEEWGKVFRITVSDGLICVLATEIPEVAIPIRLKVVR